jgi:hypothetical protein
MRALRQCLAQKLELFNLLKSHSLVLNPKTGCADDEDCTRIRISPVTVDKRDER